MATAMCNSCGQVTDCKGSGMVGKKGAFCADCGGEVKCPHPNVIRRNPTGNRQRQPGQCAWCGKGGL